MQLNQDLVAYMTQSGYASPFSTPAYQFGCWSPPAPKGRGQTTSNTVTITSLKKFVSNPRSDNQEDTDLC